MKSLAIIVSPRAAREIDAACRWWARHGSPTLIDDALAAVLDRLESFPSKAPRVRINGKWSTTRRAAVDPVGYHLYYRFDARAETIWVRCFWHSRRRPPRL